MRIQIILVKCVPWTSFDNKFFAQFVQMSQSEASGCKEAPDQEMKPAEEDCFQIL